MSDMQDLLEELAESGEERGAGAVFARATQRAGQRRRARRRIGIASALASMLVIVVVIAAIAQSRSTGNVPNQVGVDGRETTTTIASATAAQLAAGHWSTFPPAPIKPRIGASVVWTGTELIVWGGEGNARQGYFADGAAFDPGRGTWRKLAASPLTPRLGAAAAWTGTEMIVWGGNGRGLQGAIYRPRSNSWRAMARSPIVSGSFVPAVWTDDRFIVFGGAHSAAYDPNTNGWRRLPPIPAHPLAGFKVHSDGVRLAVAAGPGRVLVWSMWDASRRVSATKREGAGGSDVLRYDEASDSWTLLAAAPDASRMPREGFWTGTRVLVRGNLHLPGTLLPGPVPDAGASYDPETGRATSLPADALEADRRSMGAIASAWTGRALLSLVAAVPRGLNTNTSAYDEASNRWRLLPRAPFSCSESAPAVWTGGEVLMYCPAPRPTQAEPVGGLEFIPG
jgi:hypothetical protein